MIKHVAWWTLKEEAFGKSADENAVFLKEWVDRIAPQIPAILSVETSLRFLESTTENPEFLLVTTHADEEGYREYRNNPIHQEFGTYVHEASTARKAIDYVID